jgi:hypothetical protein
MTGPGSFRHHSLGGSVSFAHPGHGFTFGCTVESQMGPARRRTGDRCSRRLRGSLLRGVGRRNTTCADSVIEPVPT